ncbi:Thioredoxin-like 3-2, chloroplastic [Linum perenne]
MSESVPLSRLCPIGALPSSRIPTTSSLICSSSFPFRGPRNRSSSGLIAVSSSGSKFPIFSVVKNGQGSVQELDNEPISIELLPICSETQFDLVIAESKQLHQGAIVVWMANWCRKCIYLKPKLERLAADYHPSLRFYCVDVNNVPHKLVARAGVTKMPTIQLWRDGEKQGEVIGGHKAYQVINEVREMIESNIEGDI